MSMLLHDAADNKSCICPSSDASKAFDSVSDDFSLNCLIYRDVPYCIICVSYTSILECYYENKSLAAVC